MGTFPEVLHFSGMSPVCPVQNPVKNVESPQKFSTACLWRLSCAHIPLMHCLNCSPKRTGYLRRALRLPAFPGTGTDYADFCMF